MGSSQSNTFFNNQNNNENNNNNNNNLRDTSNCCYNTQHEVPMVTEDTSMSEREIARNAFLKHIESVQHLSSSSSSSSVPPPPPGSQIDTEYKNVKSLNHYPEHHNNNISLSHNGTTVKEQSIKKTIESCESDTTLNKTLSKPAQLITPELIIGTSCNNTSVKHALSNTSESLLIEALFACTLSSELQLKDRMIISDPALYESNRVILLLPSQPFYEESEDSLNTSEHAAGSARDHHLSRTLSFMDIDTILDQGIRFFITKQHFSHLRWLGACYARCTSNYIESVFMIHRAWTHYQLQDKSYSLTQLQAMIVNYAVLSLRCPEYFMESTEHYHRGLYIYQFLHHAPAHLGLQFLSQIFDEFTNNSDEELELEPLLNETLNEIDKHLIDRDMMDLKLSTVHALQLLISVKLVTSSLGYQSMFIPPNTPLKTGAWGLQFTFLLGHLLRPTPLDEPFFPQDPSKSTRQRLFSNILHRTMTAMNQPLITIRRTLADMILSNSAIITGLCRSQQKNAILQWFAAVLSSNEPKHHHIARMQMESLGNNCSSQFETVILRTQGLSTTGFNLNLFWLLLKLLEPVKLNKVNSLDPFYLLRDDSQNLLGSFAQEACFGDSDDLKKAKQFYVNESNSSLPPKFPTQLLFLALRALHCLFCPALKDYESLISKLDEVGREIQHHGSQVPQILQDRYELLFGKVFCFHAVLLHQDFMTLWWKFCTLFMTFLSRIMLAYDLNGNLDERIEKLIENKGYNITWLLHNEIPAAQNNGVPLQLLSIPLCCFDDMTECIRLFLSLPSENNRRDVALPNISQGLSYLDAELLAAMSLFFMRSDTIVRNPHSRLQSGSQTLVLLCTHSMFESRLNLNEGVVKWLIPSLVGSFIDAQKAGYYGRIQQRLLDARLLERVLPAPQHTERLKAYATNPQQQEIFVRFLAMLVESMTWLLDEAMSTLAEIKKREILPTTGNIQSASHSANNDPLNNSSDALENDQRTTNHNNTDDENFDAAIAEEGHNVSSIPFEQLERLCQTLMDGGLRSVKVMAIIAGICGDLIVNSTLLLPQVVTSLDCCLEHLVGPRCLQLKVSNFEKYNFEPRQLLASICEVYISLNEADNQCGKLLHSAICNDSRYFKPSVFLRAHQIARREGLMRASELSKFSELTNSLQQKATEFEIEEQWLAKIWDEVPDEFKDPIMDDLMTDPVTLPTSGHIMDRKHIERHLMTEEFDPFNRMPLKKSDLIPENELQKRIQTFLVEKRNEDQN